LRFEQRRHHIARNDPLENAETGGASVISWESASIWDQIAWVAAVVGGIGAGVAIPAIALSMFKFRKQTQAEHYRQLDEMYFQVQSFGMTYPEVAWPERRAVDQDTAARYDIYAAMVWNFIETLFDRCLDRKELWDTWQPAIIYEGVLHREWFNEAENRVRYKESFQEFMNAGAFAPKEKTNPLCGAFPKLGFNSTATHQVPLRAKVRSGLAPATP
jgi:hypothetical protein